MAPETDRLEAGLVCLVVFLYLSWVSVKMPPYTSLLSCLLRVWTVIYFCLGFYLFIPFGLIFSVDPSSFKPSSMLLYLVFTVTGPMVFQISYSQVPAFTCLQAALMLRPRSHTSFLFYLPLAVPLLVQTSFIYISVKFPVTESCIDEKFSIIEIAPMVLPLSLYLSSLIFLTFLVRMSPENLSASNKPYLGGHSTRWLVCQVCLQILTSIALAFIFHFSGQTGHVSLQCAVALLHPSLMRRLFIRLKKFLAKNFPKGFSPLLPPSLRERVERFLPRQNTTSAEQNNPKLLIIASANRTFQFPHSRVSNIDGQAQWDALNEEEFLDVRIEDPNVYSPASTHNIVAHVAAGGTVVLHGNSEKQHLAFR